MRKEQMKMRNVAVETNWNKQLLKLQKNKKNYTTENLNKTYNPT